MPTTAHRSAVVASVASKVTKARLVARFTDALNTARSLASARSMRVAQALQCIPPRASSTVATGRSSSSGGAAGSEGTVSINEPGRPAAGVAL